MSYQDSCLLVEGGGMRGLYSAGVLAYMHNKGVRFPHVLGVSSGALWACTYVAGKVEPDFDRVAKLLPTSGFFNPAGLLHPTRGLFRTDVLIDAVLTDDVLSAALQSPTELHIPATDALTGRLYWRSSRSFTTPSELRAWVQASCSIPVVMPKCTVDGKVWADGGIVDSIPLSYAQQTGSSRQVLLLTRPKGYRKPPQHLELYLRTWLAPYPNLRRAMLERHIHYNASIEKAERAEAAGQAFVVRAASTGLARFEYSPKKLRAAFDQGKSDAASFIDEMRAFIQAP